MGRSITERCFRALIENGDDVLMLTDEHATMLYVSPSVERLIGYMPDELIDEIAFAFTHPDDAEHDLETLAKLLADPEATVESQCRVRHKDGHYIEMELRGKNLLGEPDVAALAFSARDVTERNRALRQVAETGQQLQMLADNARDIIAIYRLVPEPKTAYISPSVERILGYPPQRFYDDPAVHYQLIHPDDRWKLEELAEHPELGFSQPITLRWIRADGEVAWVEQLTVPIRDDQGTIVATQTISRDVTDKVSLERKLLGAQKMEALGRMAGGIAHDFNNLMGVIRLSAGCIARDHPGDAELQQDLAQIDESVERGVRLVRSLLAFSQHERETAEVVDLHDVVLGLDETLKRLVPDAIETTLDLEASSPWVRIGRGALEQVVVNLTVNARDAMPDGGTLAIATASRGDRVTLSVRDTGVGMNAEQRERVFEPFYTTKEPGSGSGLGLAVVYGIVEQSGGDVRVESSPGAGTEVRIVWPRADHEPRAAPPATSPDVREQSATILMVEDEAQLRSLIGNALRRQGFEIIVAADAREALAQFDEHAGAIDLLLTDVVMPGESGVELANRLREQRPDLRVLFMTGHPGDALANHGANDAVLRKPFTIDVLSGAVRAALNA